MTGNGIDFVSNPYGGPGTTHYNSIVNLWGGDAYGNPQPGLYTLFVGFAKPDANGDALLDGNGNPVAPEYVYFYEGGTLTLTQVPEPATYAALLGAAALGFVALRRRLAAA